MKPCPLIEERLTVVSLLQHIRKCTLTVKVSQIVMFSCGLVPRPLKHLFANLLLNCYLYIHITVTNIYLADSNFTVNYFFLCDEFNSLVKMIDTATDCQELKILTYVMAS